MKILLASAAIATLALAGCSHDKEMMAKEAPAPAATVETQTEAVMIEETMSDGTVVQETVVEETVVQETVAEEASSNPAADTCYENGGSLVTWTDADGESIDACRTADGSEYSLEDYLMYGIKPASEG